MLARWPGKLYALLFTLLPLGVMGWAWARLAVNVPKWDDHALKFFLFELDGQTTWTGAAGQFLKQHNEHRIAYDRLLTWLDFSLFGKLSFLRLMVYGNLGLLAIAVLFGVVLARYVRTWWVFLPPVVLVLVNLSQWENLYWAMSALQNFSVVAWVGWSLYCLSHRPRPGLAIGLAAVATLVSGNGLLVWPAGIVVLLVQRRFRQLPYWLAAAALLITGYFWTYTQPTTHPPSRGTSLELLTGLFAFLGAAVDALPVQQSFWPSVGAGVVLLGYWGYVVVRQFIAYGHAQRLSFLHAFALGLVAFVLGTAVIVVWGRYGYGRETLLTSRYRIYSLTLLAFSYTYWLSTSYQQESGWKAAVGLGVGGLLWISSMGVNVTDSLALRRYLLTSQYNWTYTTNRPVATIDASTQRWITNAPAYYDTLLPALFAPLTGPLFPIDSVFRAGDTYHIWVHTPARDVAHQPTLAHPDRGYTVLLRSARRTYLLPALPQARRHWRVVAGLLPRYYPDIPIDLAIAANELAGGTYQIGVIRCGAVPADGRVFPTNQRLTITPHAEATGPSKNW